MTGPWCEGSSGLMFWAPRLGHVPLMATHRWPGERIRDCRLHRCVTGEGWYRWRNGRPDPMDVIGPLIHDPANVCEVG